MTENESGIVGASEVAGFCGAEEDDSCPWLEPAEEVLPEDGVLDDASGSLLLDSGADDVSDEALSPAEEEEEEVTSPGPTGVVGSEEESVLAFEEESGSVLCAEAADSPVNWLVDSVANAVLHRPDNAKKTAQTAAICFKWSFMQAVILSFEHRVSLKALKNLYRENNFVAFARLQTEEKQDLEITPKKLIIYCTILRAKKQLKC